MYRQLNPPPPSLPSKWHESECTHRCAHVQDSSLASPSDAQSLLHSHESAVRPLTQYMDVLGRFKYFAT